MKLSPYLTTVLLFILEMLGPKAVASYRLDRELTLHTMAVAVTNAAENPVYADAVVKEVVKGLSRGAQYEPSEIGSHYLKERFAGRPAYALGTDTTVDVSPIADALTELARRGGDAAILVEVQSDSNFESYRLRMALVSARAGVVLHEVTATVENKDLLDSFAAATRDGLGALLKAVPFAGEVSAREGARVVLDRGAPEFRRGKHFFVVTVDSVTDGSLVLRDVGEVVVTRAEAHLAFARVVGETPGSAIAAGNKIVPVLGRAIAAEDAFSDETATVRRGRYGLGIVDFGLGYSSVHFNAAGTNGAVGTKDGGYASGTLGLEAWLTNRFFFRGTFDLGMATVPGDANAQPTQLGSSVSGLRFVVGYRLPLLTPMTGLEVTVRAGYGRQAFSVDQTTSALSLNSTSYSGLLFGAGIKAPIYKSFGLGLDFTTLVFPSVSQNPVTSGGASGVSAMDFALRAYYAFFPDMDLDLKFVFGRYAASFSGAGSRAVPLTSASQGESQFILGLSKYF